MEVANKSDEIVKLIKDNIGLKTYVFTTGDYSDMLEFDIVIDSVISKLGNAEADYNDNEGYIIYYLDYVINIELSLSSPEDGIYNITMNKSIT